jgi:hypothetical protein
MPVDSKANCGRISLGVSLSKSVNQTRSSGHNAKMRIIEKMDNSILPVAIWQQIRRSSVKAQHTQSRRLFHLVDIFFGNQ